MSGKELQTTQTSDCTLISFWVLSSASKFSLLLIRIHPKLSSENNIENKLVTIKATFCWFWGCLWMRRMVTMKDTTNKARRPILQGSKLAMKWIPYVMRTLKPQIKQAVWKKSYRNKSISALKRKWLLRRMIASFNMYCCYEHV